MLRDFQKLRFYGLTLVLNAATITVLVLLSTGGFTKRSSGAVTYTAPVVRPKTNDVKIVKSGLPISLHIPSMNITLPVQAGEYNESDGSWTLNDVDAFYATPSAPINDQKGNTLIYGHNIQNVFGRLPELNLGSELEITTDSNYQFIYTYNGVKEVAPEDTSIFTYDTPPTVMLQTCSGAWDRFRSMYTFSLQKVIQL